MRTGHTPSRTKPDYWDDVSIPWFTLADVWQLREGHRYLGETKELISPRGLQSSAAELLPEGTVVLSRTASVGFTGIMPRPMATSQDFWNWVCGPRMLPTYLWYQLRAMNTEFDRLKSGSTHKTIYQADAAALRVVVPPIEVQRQIADYLDHETAEIDAFIADLHALKAGLNEHRMAELAGLLSYPGDVFRPDSSTLTSLKRLGSITLGKMLDPARSTDDTRWPYLRAANVQPLGRLELADVKTMRFTPAERACLDIKAGDVLIVEGGQGGYGRAAYVSADLPGTGFQNSIVRFPPAPTTDGRYVAYALQLLRHSGYIKTVASVTSMPHFTAEKVAIAPVPRVTLERQREVADALDLRWAEIDEAIDDIDAAISLAKERRAALITAAVTGQIDVTTKGSREHADL